MRAMLHTLEPRRLFAAGVLDPKFGTDGFVQTDFDGRTGENVVDMAVQPDGKIVTLVPSNGNAVPPVVLARYNKDGTLDGTFGTGGRVSVDFGDDVALGRLGTIVVGGVFDDPVNGDDFGVRRYTRNGALDTTFGTNGLARTDFGAVDADLADLAVARDGRIVAVGTADVAGFAVASYTRDGAPDLTFDTDGKLTTAFTNGSARGRSVAIQPDGKIVAGGTEEPTFSAIANEGRFAVARYNRNGSLDTTFGGGDGLVSTTIDANEAELRDLALQRDGRIVALGQFTDALDGPAFARFNRDGSFDATFGGDGTSVPVFIPGGDPADVRLTRIAVDRAGMVYAAGRVRVDLVGGGRGEQAAVARLTRTGSADEPFAPSGLMRRDFSPVPDGDDRLASIAMTRSGVVLGGTTTRLDGTRDAVIAQALFDRAGGVATLSRSGTLSIRGTLGSDVLRTNVGPVQAGGAQDLIVRINDRPGQAFNLANVRRVVVSAGNGNDRVTLGSATPDDNGLPIGTGGRPAIIDGGLGNDTLVGEDVVDSIKGGPGDDFLSGRIGADILNGGPGNDTRDSDSLDRVIGIENVQP